jgi:hypothetical protein
MTLLQYALTHLLFLFCFETWTLGTRDSSRSAAADNEVYEGAAGSDQETEIL